MHFGAGSGAALGYLSIVLLLALLCLSASGAARGRGWFLFPTTGLVLIAALILNSTRWARFEEWCAKAGINGRAAFSWSLAAILFLGILLRVLLTSAVRLPLVMPDSFLYLMGALLNPSFPIGDARPVVFPYLIAGALFIFGHPIGILIVHNVLAIFAAGVFVWALRTRCGMGVTALFMAVYLLFVEKNLDFEYLLLTEHLTRVLYLLFIAALLFYWGSRAVFPQVLLGLLAVANILTKSSAIVLVPGFLLWRLADREIGWSLSRLWKASRWFAATVAILLGIYIAAGYRALGFFPLSSMTGHALYYQVNPLTVFDTGAYPEIKRELKTFFPLYLEKYWHRGQNLGNWAIWGYPESPSVVRDFGSQSPARAIQDYIAKHPSGPPFPQADRIFRELSFEAIRAHPRDYVALSFRSLWSLLVHGLSFTYESKPFGKLPAYIEREATLRTWFHKAEVEWPDEPIRARVEPDWVARSFARHQGSEPNAQELVSLACQRLAHSPGAHAPVSKAIPRDHRAPSCPCRVMRPRRLLPDPSHVRLHGRASALSLQHSGSDRPDSALSLERRVTSDPIAGRGQRTIPFRIKTLPHPEMAHRSSGAREPPPSREAPPACRRW